MELRSSTTAWRALRVDANESSAMCPHSAVALNRRHNTLCGGALAATVPARISEGHERSRGRIPASVQARGAEIRCASRDPLRIARGAPTRCWRCTKPTPRHLPSRGTPEAGTHPEAAPGSTPGKPALPSAAAPRPRGSSPRRWRGCEALRTPSSRRQDPNDTAHDVSNYGDVLKRLFALDHYSDVTAPCARSQGAVAR